MWSQEFFTFGRLIVLSVYCDFKFSHKIYLTFKICKGIHTRIWPLAWNLTRADKSTIQSSDSYLTNLRRILSTMEFHENTCIILLAWFKIFDSFNMFSNVCFKVLRPRTINVLLGLRRCTCRSTNVSTGRKIRFCNAII